MNQQLGKEYKLCNKQLIDALFDGGRSQKQYPFIVKYAVQELKSNTPFQMVIAAPKRTFKTAVQRNRIKRICREAVRKNKTELESFLNDQNRQLGIFLLYTGKEEILPAKLEQKTRVLFQKIIDDLQHNYA
ncbi:MAG: ribonuclease P protein component [bacterium]|nr:ribonuclease P protein component [bacterium]